MSISQNFPQLRGMVWHTKNESFIRRIAIQDGEKWRVESDYELEQRKMREGSVNKAMGMLPGVPDILFIWKGKLHGIELKVDGGVVSPAQKELHRTWLENGVTVVVCYSVEQVLLRVKSIIYENNSTS